MYYLVFGILYLLSLLPFWVLYRISDFFYLLGYYVIRYRRAVVMSNLAHAFPEKTAGERVRIAKKFYRNFMDAWVETIKLLSISKASLGKRVTGDFTVLHQMHASGRPVQGNFGHFFNWELFTLFASIGQPYTFLGVYYPQKSQVADRLLKYIRSRWGNPLIASNDLVRGIIPWRKKQYLLALGGDQNTPFVHNAYWLYYMSRPVPFVKGPEKFARGQKIPVVTMTVTKPKRGHYQHDFSLMAEDPMALPEGELMRRYVKQLEANIRLQPELYLWSHRRWKYPWLSEFKDYWVDERPYPAFQDIPKNEGGA